MNVRATKQVAEGERVTFRAKVLRFWEVGGLRMCLVGDASGLTRVELGDARVLEGASYQFRDAAVKQYAGGWTSISIGDGGSAHRLDDDVRGRAIESIGAYDSAWVRQAIQNAYESGEHSLKVSAVHAMGRSAESRWLPLLVRELSNEDAEIRFEAAVAIGQVAEESAIPHLVPLLTDEDEEVRSAAVSALGEIGGERAKSALMEMLDSASDATREAAAAALSEIEFEEDPLGFRFRQ